MTPAAPQVTVLIPVHNRAGYVAVAIGSVLGQTFPDFELLVVDDGSTDGTAEVVRACEDPRLRLLRNGANLGIPRTRNLGLAHARGRYVAMLDSDDWAEPHRLARQVAFLDAHLDHALVGANKRRLGETKPIDRTSLHRPLSPAAVRAGLVFMCCIAQTSVMGRTTVLRGFGYDERFPVCQDFELFARLAAEGHVLANLPDVLVRYRHHPGQVSRRRDLIADRMMVVLARQLSALGVAFTGEDLRRHFLLGRPRSWFEPDGEYLDWAEVWLDRLGEANRRAGAHPEAVFLATLDRVRLEVRERVSGARAALWRRVRRSLARIVHWSPPPGGERRSPPACSGPPRSPARRGEDPGTTPRVAVCVCTCDRPRLLGRLLAILERIEPGDRGSLDGVELVVVDNRPDGRARAVCDAWRGRLLMALRFVEEPEPGISFARNRALAAALEGGAELVAFIDDDDGRARTGSPGSWRPSGRAGPTSCSAPGATPRAWPRPGCSPTCASSSRCGSRTGTPTACRPGPGPST
jgi:glycosyltransferase involved in cell wall biosynthesis